MSHRKLIQRLFADHAGSLQVFFRKRIREQRDALDLTQEVYLRLLRAGENRQIKNPEAYLFTVANNLVKERQVMQRRDALRVGLSEPGVSDRLKDEAMAVEPNVISELEHEVRARYLRRVLPELPPRSQLALALAFEEGLSHQEIALRLRVSKTMVHKILTQAISHCRNRMRELEVL